MVKGWGGFVGGSRFKSQWGQKFTCQKKCYCEKDRGPLMLEKHNGCPFFLWIEDCLGSVLLKKVTENRKIKVKIHFGVPRLGI